MRVPAIKLTKVTKKYGISRGVQNISLTVNQGEVFGFIGPNGAGKTTTIRMLMDFIQPTSGSIKLLGLDSHRDIVSLHRRIGYLAGDMALDNNLTGRQYLEYMANLRGGVPWSTIQRLIDRLECETDRKIGLLSRGNKQKVGLISALMHDPDLIILDEPTSGLDPLIQAEFQKLIQEHRKRGKTAFISSHILSEVQELCDHVGFIREGELVDVQPLKDMMRKSFKKVSVTLSRPNKKALQGVKGISDLTVKGTHITCKVSDDYNQLIAALAKLQVKDIVIEEASLDDLFMHYYEHKEQN